MALQKLQQDSQACLLGHATSQHQLLLIITLAHFLAGVLTADISNVVLVSDWHSDGPTSIKDLLWPPVLRADSNPEATVNMTNVLLLYDVPPASQAHAVATLRGVVSDPVVQQGLADWSLNLYTVGCMHSWIGSCGNPHVKLGNMARATGANHRSMNVLCLGLLAA
jgi:hypothetical protein